MVVDYSNTKQQPKDLAQCRTDDEDGGVDQEREKRRVLTPVSC